MFRPILFTAILCFTTLLWADVTRLSQPVSEDAQSETFGALMDNDVALTTLTTLMEKGSNKPFRLTTRIAKVCQKKGCFFIAQENEHVIRVAFKDYGFFIPTDASGKTVTLMGELVKTKRSKAQADHFNQDLGTHTLADGEVFEILASSIVIPKS